MLTIRLTKEREYELYVIQQRVVAWCKDISTVSHKSNPRTSKQSPLLISDPTTKDK